MRYSKSVVFLIVWFTWATGRQLDAIVRYPTTSDYYVFSSIDMPWLYFVLAAPVFALNVGALYSLFRPNPQGIRFIYNAILFGMIQVVVSVSIAMQDLAGTREAYVTGREIRGFPVREEAANKVFSQNGMLMSVGIFFLLYLVVAYYAHRNRTYLLGEASERFDVDLH